MEHSRLFSVTHRSALLVSIAASCLVFLGTTSAAPPLLENGGFEGGRAGWNVLWSRTQEISGGVQQDVVRSGRNAMAFEHRGLQDWSLNRTKPIDVRPGDVFELSADVMLSGEGKAVLAVVLYDDGGKVRDWSYAERSTGDTAGHWVTLRTRLVIPPGSDRIVPRILGSGPSRGAIDNVALRLVDHLSALDLAPPTEPLVLENARLRLAVNSRTGCFDVTDRRTGRNWRQTPNQDAIVLGAAAAGEAIRVALLDTTGTLPVTATVGLDADRPEVVVELTGEGEMASRLQYPAPFVQAEGDWLILPVNEGIGYPAADASLPEMRYHLHGGHGLCMGWYGMMAPDGAGVMTVVETPDDAEVRIARTGGLLALWPVWKSQLQRFGSPRRLRYVFFDAGGYVAMCKDYRRRMIERGHLKTLAAKREENPDVDLLVGAVNVWNWDTPADEMCRALKAAGIDRILWSRRAKPEQIDAMNAMGRVLTSRYDIYQDCMDPAMFPKLYHVHPDWTSEAFPEQVIRMADGDWAKGWRVPTRDGEMYPCACLCDHFNVEFAGGRVPEELRTHAYRSRFIDTTTAASWRECYDPRHRMTRSDCKRLRMELLAYMSETCNLVTGSETGHEAAVPHVHYFEGMMSLGPYRVPGAGRNMSEIVEAEDVPERVATFQTGHYYRLPLWELVYHDCVVAQWYWGDYNNKLPSLWDRRDQWNALYGTPPMFLFKHQFWVENKERFVKSYETIAPVARATGYREMLSHEWLTADHALQRTRFEGGVAVTVNFGERPLQTPDGVTIAPGAVVVEGLDP